MKGRQWTRREEQRLAELFGVLPKWQIAELMGRTWASIKMRIRKLKLAPIRPHWSSDEDQRLIRLHALEWTDEEISIRLDRDPGTVRIARRRLGLPAHPPSAKRRRTRISRGLRRYYREHEWRPNHEQLQIRSRHEG